MSDKLRIAVERVVQRFERAEANGTRVRGRDRRFALEVLREGLNEGLEGNAVHQLGSEVRRVWAPKE